MIYLSFAITWPFKYNPDFYGDYLFNSWKISKNKAIELQVSKGGDEIIGASLRLAFREDHAGLMIDLSLFRRSFYFQFYDVRHWNYEKNCYETYEDDE
jgi:hypothetical protein